ncbi:MAG: hypothetical protein AYK18_14935 [Theionarchaea archaeon DG-70]|nr:MAG: hypothetical protein AYK18_14935 [Theionarchaea archaeon DG-70]
MITVTLEVFLRTGRILYGEKTEKWKFICPNCERVQSAESVIQRCADGIPSKRYGELGKGERLSPETCCYSPDCDYTANGLLNTGILAIRDPNKPHDIYRKENCTFVFPFADFNLKHAGQFNVKAWYFHEVCKDCANLLNCNRTIRRESFSDSDHDEDNAYLITVLHISCCESCQGEPFTEGRMQSDFGVI